MLSASHACIRFEMYSINAPGATHVSIILFLKHEVQLHVLQVITLRLTHHKKKQSL